MVVYAHGCAPIRNPESLTRKLDARPYRQVRRWLFREAVHGGVDGSSASDGGFGSAPCSGARRLSRRTAVDYSEATPRRSRGRPPPQHTESACAVLALHTLPENVTAWQRAFVAAGVVAWAGAVSPCACALAAQPCTIASRVLRPRGARAGRTHRPPRHASARRGRPDTDSNRSARVSNF